MHFLREQLHIITFVRRVVFTLVCLGCALNVRASVPSVTSAKLTPPQANVSFGKDLNALQSRQNFTMATAPADKLSFYQEFYGDRPATKVRKTGLLHRFTTTLKKTVQRVNFLPY